MAERHGNTVDPSIDDYKEGYMLCDKDPKKKRLTITFNRPEKLNAMNKGMFLHLNDVINAANEDEDVKVIVFKGAGKHFGSGADVGHLGVHHGWGKPGDRRPSQRRRFIYDKHAVFGWGGYLETVLRCDKATIASVQGYCYAAHCELALACDITVATDDVMFTHPGYRYIGPMGPMALWFLTAGVKKVKEMMLTGMPFTAEDALRYGLVNKVVSRDQLEAETEKIANIIALQPFDSIVMGKAQFELAQDIMGVGTGYTASAIAHSWMTNIRYEPDEFNLFKVKSEKGVKGALEEREKRFKNARLSQGPKKA